MNLKTAVACICMLGGLAGCGVETASTAATAAQMKAQEVEQAKKQLEAAKKEIDAAQQLATQRLQEADRMPDLSAERTAPSATSSP